MNKVNYFNLIFFIFLILQSCEYENFESDTVGGFLVPADLQNEIFKEENFGPSVTRDFIGVVKDQEGNKLSNVEINIGDSYAVSTDNNVSFYKVTTDRNGVFVANDVDVYENYVYLRAQKSGYLIGTKVLIPNKERVTNVEIVLTNWEFTETINSGEVSKVTLPNGASVAFDGIFKNYWNTPFDGSVNVNINYFEPNTKKTLSEMPGSSFAQNTSYDPRNIESYGILYISLDSPDSSEGVYLGEGSKAIIEFPIDDSQIDTAPDLINLWFYSRFNGYWRDESFFVDHTRRLDNNENFQGKEASFLIKKGNVYVGEVTKLNNYLNCGLPIEYVNFCFPILQTTSGEPDPLSFFYTEIKKTDKDQLIFSGNVLGGQADDPKCIQIPKNENITVSIYSSAESCTNILLHEESFGPYREDTTQSISFSEVSSTITTTITGVFNNCFGDPITNGYIFEGESVIGIFDGNFNHSIVHCTNEIKDFIVYDLNSHTESDPQSITLNGTDINLGIISTCTGSGGVFKGNVVLSSQEEVDIFALGMYTEIDGNLYIGSETGTNITSLSGLSSIEMISGNIEISNNNDLLSFEGLDNINTIENLYISNNDALVSISATDFPGLTLINGTLSINNNNSLTSIRAFENITTLNQFNISNNDALVSILATDFPSLSHINGGVYINSNINLTNITFSALTHVNDLIIQRNSSLQSIIANSLGTIEKDFLFNDNDLMTSLGEFNNLATLSTGINSRITINDNNLLESMDVLEIATTIGFYLEIINNNSLVNLTGLNNVTSIASYATIRDNSSLVDFTGLNNLISIGSSFRIENNGSLVDFTGLNNLTRIEGPLEITNNDSLVNLTGLNNLTSIGGIDIIENQNLISLDGLNNVVDDVYRVHIENNSSLNDLCALQNLFVNGVGGNILAINVYIIMNALNPTVKNLIDGNCKSN